MKRHRRKESAETAERRRLAAGDGGLLLVVEDFDHHDVAAATRTKRCPVPPAMRDVVGRWGYPEVARLADDVSVASVDHLPLERQSPAPVTDDLDAGEGGGAHD